MMYQCRCPYDGKKLAHIARPLLSDLRCVHLCACGQRVEGKVQVKTSTKRIIGQVKCSCGKTTEKTPGYLVAIKCRKGKAIIQF
jgi:hypothetical protein